MASLRNKKLVLAPDQQYEFPLHGDSLRVVSANVPIYFKTQDGALDFYLEQGEKATFEGQDFLTLVIYHLDVADQTVIISIGKDADIGSAKFSGNVSISNAVALDAATIAAMESVDANPIVFGSSLYYSTAFVANTPVQLIAPGANVNGIVLHKLSLASYNAATHNWNVLAKASAPANISDGDIILSLENGLASTVASGKVERATKILAGKGLYVYPTVAASVVALMAQYTIL